MQLKGYFIVKLRKTLNMYLFSENKEDLEPLLSKGQEIATYYKDGDKAFIEMSDGRLLRVK